MLYLVTSIAQRGLRLAERLAVPEVLRCAELYHALYDARLWMSLGNTTSSMHFDTHENLLLQLSGEKEVLLWHPDESANFYLDHHEKFGLSPINVDRVDLERFPSVANATTYIANLSAGDAVYIPDGWWHVVRSHSRNVAIALEFAPYGGEADAWPTAVLERKGRPASSGPSRHELQPGCESSTRNASRRGGRGGRSSAMRLSRGCRRASRRCHTSAWSRLAEKRREWRGTGTAQVLAQVALRRTPLVIKGIEACHVVSAQQVGFVFRSESRVPRACQPSATRY